MIQMRTYETREEWLKARKSYIGGSDAAAVLGMNPWMSNTELWEIKTGRRTKTFLDDNEFVKYGHAAEPLLRELFKLDYPEMEVFYEEGNMWTNDRYPFAHASLDSWLKDEFGRLGILEIKTSNLLNKSMSDKWKDQIPDNYYLQCLHYMMVLEADFAIVKAQLKSERDGDVYLQTKHYWIERRDVEEDIETLREAEEEFYQCILKDKEPALILPEI
jgi:putative phage-type endonuclease